MKFQSITIICKVTYVLVPTVIIGMCFCDEVVFILRDSFGFSWASEVEMFEFNRLSTIC